jgi:hypothetical protein
VVVVKVVGTIGLLYGFPIGIAPLRGDKIVVAVKGGSAGESATTATTGAAVKSRSSRDKMRERASRLAGAGAERRGGTIRRK